MYTWTYTSLISCTRGHSKSSLTKPPPQQEFLSFFTVFSLLARALESRCLQICSPSFSAPQIPGLFLQHCLPAEAEKLSRLEVFPEFAEALEGLDGFSHIFVLSYLDRLRPEQIGPLKVKPRRLLRRGFKIEELPSVGVFAIDSPTRPNPIGLSLVKLLRREGGRLFVLGLDCFDGAPILDIKPYRDDYRIDQYELADWYRELRNKIGKDF